MIIKESIQEKNLIYGMYVRNDLSIYLLQHNKRAAHTERMKSKNTNLSLLTQSSFVDCGESIKEEDIKEDINEEESVDDPLTIQQEIEKCVVCEDIKEIKEEGNVEVPLSINRN